MARTSQDFIAAATEAFEAGFTSKSAQKSAVKNLGSAYELLTNEIRAFYLNGERTEAGHDAYWIIPNDLHQYRAKHTAAIVAVWPAAANLCEEIEALVELRTAINSAELVTVERKADKVEVFRNQILDIIARRQEQFAHGVKLVEIFGKLPVTVNFHYVTNTHGTTFIRHFFYMAGKLTPLQVIMAVLEETAEA